MMSLSSLLLPGFLLPLVVALADPRPPLVPRPLPRISVVPAQPLEASVEYLLALAERLNRDDQDLQRLHQLQNQLTLLKTKRAALERALSSGNPDASRRRQLETELRAVEQKIQELEAELRRLADAEEQARQDHESVTAVRADLVSKLQRDHTAPAALRERAQKALLESQKALKRVEISLKPVVRIPAPRVSLNPR